MPSIRREGFEMDEQKHTITCPNCGYEVPARAKLGQGTQKGKNMKMNENRQRIIEVLRESIRPLSVKQVQGRLVAKQVRRVSKRGTGWNYHVVQADLSILVGQGTVQMKRPHELEAWDPEIGHTTKGIPLYKLAGVAQQ
jgi:hypothetical protein